MEGGAKAKKLYPQMTQMYADGTLSSPIGPQTGQIRLLSASICVICGQNIAASPRPPDRQAIASD